MFRSISIGVFVLISISVATPQKIHGDEPFAEKDKIDNAALVYWQAFAVLPAIPESSFWLQESENGTIIVTDGERDLLKECQSALQLAELVKPSSACRWEIVVDGPHTLMPHLSKARLLARILLTQALLDAKSERFDFALNRVRTAMMLARNVDEGGLINLLVGQAIEIQSVNVAKSFIDSVPQEAKARFVEWHSQLPPRSTLESTMRYEKELFWNWIAKVILQDKEAAIAELVKLGVETDSTDQEIMTLAASSIESRKQAVKEFSDMYDRVIETIKDDAKVDQASLQEIGQEVRTSKNPLIRKLMPGFDSVFINYDSNTESLDDFWSGLIN